VGGVDPLLLVVSGRVTFVVFHVSSIEPLTAIVAPVEIHCGFYTFVCCTTERTEYRLRLSHEKTSRLVLAVHTSRLSFHCLFSLPSLADPDPVVVSHVRKREASVQPASLRVPNQPVRMSCSVSDVRSPTGVLGVADD
jgi:hypothetical protein